MELRDFDQQGYARNGPKWAETNVRVRAAIAENLKSFEKKHGQSPKKFLRKVTISDDVPVQGKVRKIGGLMTLLIVQNSRSRLIRDVGRAIVRAYDIPPKDYVNEMWALQHWIQNNIRYTFDTGEQFQTPQRVMIDWFKGHDGADCDCLTMLYLTFCRSLGHLKLAVGLVDSRGDGVLSHAIALVKLPKPEKPWDGRWIPIELTKSKPFGWMTDKATRIIAVPLGGGGRK
jgi:hypothetical protein